MTSSILIYLIFFFLSPAIAEFYHEPRLILILRVLATIFILKGINTVSFAQITKNLDFKTIMLISISTSIGYGGISAIFGFLGFGVWSLVFGKITSQIVEVIISLWKFPVILKPSIKKKEFKELAGFGSGISLSNILFYGTSNIDYLIIGKFLNPYALGLYTRAFNLVTHALDQIMGGIYNVIFPAFAAVQNEKEKLRKAYLRIVKTVSYILFPILFSLFILSDYVIKGLYGVKWSGAIPSFKILLIAGIFRVTLKYSGAVAHATGHVFAEAFRQLIYFLILGGCAFYLIRFGIEGVAFAVLIARLWMFLALNHLAIRILSSSWREFLKAHIPALANSFILVSVNLFLVFCLENYFSASSNEIKLLIAFIINILVFLSAIIFIPVSIKGDTFNWIIDKYRKFIPQIFLKFYFAFNAQNK
jgi:O-antigen/teichoic acid export membrane protein